MRSYSWASIHYLGLQLIQYPISTGARAIYSSPNTYTHIYNDLNRASIRYLGLQVRITFPYRRAR